MPLLPDLEPTDKVLHAFSKFNTGVERPMLSLLQQTLRAPESPLTVADRELLAAYSAGLTECDYCRGLHGAIALELGVPIGTLETLLYDIERAPVEPALKPLFAYVRKLTKTPEDLTDKDADTVFAAGWSSRALYDVVAITSVMGLMTRFVEGLGLRAIPEHFAEEGRLLAAHGYEVADIFRLK